MIDLHIHTSYSDGTDDVTTVLRKAEEKGLDWISTSAKTNDKNKIEELFIKLAEEINEKGKKRNGKQKSLELKKDDSNKKKTICCIFKKEDLMDV